MKKIIVDVTPEGIVKVEAVGFVGSACLKATEAMEKAMGKVITSSRKPEFYREAQNTQSIGS